MKLNDRLTKIEGLQRSRNASSYNPNADNL